jgi:hypothetical protein
MYHQFYHSQILRSAHTVYLRVLCGSGFYNQDVVCLLRGTDWIFK